MSIAKVFPRQVNKVAIGFGLMAAAGKIKNLD